MFGVQLTFPSFETGFCVKIWKDLSYLPKINYLHIIKIPSSIFFKNIFVFNKMYKLYLISCLLSLCFPQNQGNTVSIGGVTEEQILMAFYQFYKDPRKKIIKTYISLD